MIKMRLSEETRGYRGSGYPFDRRSQSFLCGRSLGRHRKTELLPGFRPSRLHCGMTINREPKTGRNRCRQRKK